MKIKQKLAIKYIRTKLRLLSYLSKRKTAEKAFELFCTPFSKKKYTAPPVFSSSELMEYTLNNKKIIGYCWNKGKAKKVLILHGFGSAAHKFHKYVHPLVQKGYEVIAFDAPAHGGSEGKMTNVLEYTQLIELANKENGPFNGFIAHSFGGIALSLAMEKMEHDENTKMVLIAPATETSTAINDAFKMLHLQDESVRKEFNNIIFERSGKPTSWFSIRRAMNNIKATVLWVHDEDDTITPLSDALMVKEDNHPNIQFIITKGLGHRNIYQSSKIKNEVFDFL
jgi:pimeloyl-ACP methyl ester carboxylesterase